MAFDCFQHTHTQHQDNQHQELSALTTFPPRPHSLPLGYDTTVAASPCTAISMLHIAVTDSNRAKGE